MTKNNYTDTEDLFSLLFDDQKPEDVEAKISDSKTSTPVSAAPTSALNKPMTVTRLTRKIRSLVENNFSDVWVEGEISTFKDHSSGHFYFTLKDENSQIHAAMFRNANRRLKFKPENGMLVTVTGSVQIYEPQGKYQIICETMEPSGIGALQIAFEQLKKKLSEEGLFDESKKKTIPIFPKTIGVVTSESGAAIRDIINVLFRRFPNCRLVLNPAPVQGEGAAEKIAAAIDECNEAKNTGAVDFDVLIVGRGGGSMEDLWAFNEEPVARAIARSVIPVVSAVGHEIDWTIADFVADCRAPTPSAAAEIVVTPHDDWKKLIENYSHKISFSIESVFSEYKQRLERAKVHFAFKEPEKLIDRYRQQLDELNTNIETITKDYFFDVSKRIEYSFQILKSAGKIFSERVKKNRQLLNLQKRSIEKAVAQSISRRNDKINFLLGQLENLGPVSVLKRGYTITRNLKTGKVITKCSEINVGENIQTSFKDGTVNSKATEISNFD